MEKAVAEEVQIEINLFLKDLRSHPQKALNEAAATLFRTRKKEDSDDEQKRVERFFMSAPILRLSNKRKTCRMGDLWFISRNEFWPSYSEKKNCGGVWLFQSVWHSPTIEGVLQVAPLSSNFRPSQVSSDWNRKTRVHTLHGPNFEHEVAMIEVFRQLTLENPPIMPNLLLDAEHSILGESLTDGNVKNLSEVIRDVERDLAKRICLNDDQKAALAHVKGWVGAVETDPVLLIHGTFGAGKTQLTSILLVFVCEVMERLGIEDFKICVSSATNIAVDNVLKKLLDLGFEKFARVGSPKAIDPAILPYALHFSDRGLEAALKDAEHQLAGFQDKEHKLYLQQIQKKETMAKKQQMLERSCRIIGTTCCSAMRPDLIDLFRTRKTICILDEGSQVVEALSMLPVFGARTSKLIIVGDPLQLPPVVGSQAPKDSPQFADGATTLFDRMMKLGRRPIVLKTQYRCHPRIANIASHLFYNGMLENGVDEEQRSPLIDGLPTLGFLDTGASMETRTGSGSFVNLVEQQLILALVKKLIDAGLHSGQIGAIAL